MTAQRNQLEQIPQVIDGQAEIRPDDAWLGVSNGLNAEWITVAGSGVDLYSHVVEVGPGVFPIYAGSDPRRHMQGTLSNVLRNGTEGVNTFGHDYLIEGFGDIDYRVNRAKLPPSDKEGFVKLMDAARQYIRERRTEFVAQSIADLGVLIRTEEPGFWVRDGVRFSRAKALKLVAEGVQEVVWDPKAPKDDYILSKVFPLKGIHLHCGKQGRPRVVPIVTDRFGNQGPYFRKTSLYVQEATPLQITA